MDQHALPETCVDVQAASLSYAPCIVAGGLLPIHLTAEGELVPEVQQGEGRVGEGGGHDGYLLQLLGLRPALPKHVVS